MFLNALRTATQSLARHRLRTVLTALGISIGIASVMSTVALGAGGSAAIESQLDALGEQFVWILPGSANTGGVRAGAGSRRSLKVDDALALPGRVPEISGCSPVVTGREQLVNANRNWNTRYVGISPEYFTIRRWAVDRGSTFGPYEVQRRAKVAILGATVAQELFGSDDPVGRTIRMGRFPFTVIGVLRPRGSDRSGVNQDDAVVMPYTTAQRNIEGSTWVDEIICDTVSAEATPLAELHVAAALRERHGLRPGDEDDFRLRRPQESLTLRLESARTLGLMLLAVALVSLVVGGIGIMNIMLVSVTERTREIGLRLAIGARDRDIRLQFLTEALMLGVVGGVLGITLGFVSSTVLSTAFGWQTIVTLQAVGAASMFAIGSALVFGYFPARRASSLTPLDALRTD